MHDTYIKQFSNSIFKYGLLISLFFSLVCSAATAFAYDTQGYKIKQQDQKVVQQNNINRAQLPAANIGEQAICVCSTDGGCNPPGCNDGDSNVCTCGGDGEGGWVCQPAGCDGSSPSQLASPRGTNTLPKSVVDKPLTTQPIIRNPVVDPEKQINNSAFPGDQFKK